MRDSIELFNKLKLEKNLNKRSFKQLRLIKRIQETKFDHLNSSKSKLFLFLNYLKTYWFTNIYYHLKSIGIFPSKISENESKSGFNDSSTLEYVRVINLFKKISEEFDIKFVFLTEPYFNIPHQEKSIVESLNKIILESEVNVIDLESLIPKEKKYFIDNTHLNSEGNELVSNIIFEKIKSLELTKWK